MAKIILVIHKQLIGKLSEAVIRLMIRGGGGGGGAIDVSTCFSVGI